MVFGETVRPDPMPPMSRGSADAHPTFRPGTSSTATTTPSTPSATPASPMTTSLRPKRTTSRPPMAAPTAEAAAKGRTVSPDASALYPTPFWRYRA